MTQSQRTTIERCLKLASAVMGLATLLACWLNWAGSYSTLTLIGEIVLPAVSMLALVCAGMFLWDERYAATVVLTLFGTMCAAGGATMVIWRSVRSYDNLALVPDLPRDANYWHGMAVHAQSVGIFDVGASVLTFATFVMTLIMAMLARRQMRRTRMAYASL